MATWPRQVEIRPQKPFSNIKNDCILLTTYCMQGSELSAFCVLSSLIPATTSYSRFSYIPHFMHEETEAQRGQAICPRSYSSSVEHPGPGLRYDRRIPELVLWTLWMCACWGTVFRWVHRGRDWVPGSQGSPRGEGRCLILGPWQPENQQLHHRCERPSEPRCSWSHHPVEQQGGAGVSAPPPLHVPRVPPSPRFGLRRTPGYPRSGARGDA